MYIVYIVLYVDSIYCIYNVYICIYLRKIKKNTYNLFFSFLCFSVLKS